jgi:hypothetical protein
MQDSDFQTLTVQPIGSNTPTTLAKAATAPLRVLVNNVGPVVLFISKSVTDLAPRPTTASYRVLPGEEHVFVIMPKQSAYAVGAAVGGLVSVSQSEALPAGH